MLWAAVLSLLMAAAGSAALGIDVTQDPQQFVYLFALTLLGTWESLAAAKATEGRELDAGARRLLDLILGGLLGVAALVLAPWLGVTSGASPAVWQELGPWVHSMDLPSTPLRYPAYFALLFLILGSWKSLGVRDRKARFRLMPPIGTTLAAGILLPLWPLSLPTGVAAATSIAIVTQLVSPWNAAAAAYTRAQPRRKVA